MRIGIRRLLIPTMFAVLATAALADAPDCTGREDWPAGMAYAQLKNAGIADASTLDFDKTTVTRLASEKIGADLYRQVHRVRFVTNSGKPIVVITVNEVSSVECSRSGVDVYVVSKRLGNYSEGH